MKDLITEARELCKYSEKIVNQLHTERLDYELEYMPLIETIQVTSELCDALEKAEAECEQMKTAISRYCRNDCYRDACTGNEDVGIRDCPMAKYAPPLPAPPEEGE